MPNSTGDADASMNADASMHAPKEGGELEHLGDADAPMSAPKEGGLGEWQVQPVQHGFDRWSKKSPRCDVHCRIHLSQGTECKMDRSMTRGGLGLVWLWLKRGAGAEYTSQHIMK